MQSLESFVPSMKKEKIKRLTKELRAEVGDCSNRENIICPICKYQSKAGKGTAKVFDDGENKSFKCFACGVWRRL